MSIPVTYRMAVVRSDAAVTDDDVLVYDQTDGTWVPSDAPASTSVATFREAVATSTALPTTGNEAGDVRLTEDTDHLWLWDGTAWVDAGPAGIPGQDGEDGSNGSDAEVTDANVAAAIGDDTRAVIEGWGIGGGGGAGLALNLADYDVVGDGVTDNTAKVAQALADAKALAPFGGGSVVIPPGQRVATEPVVMAEGVSLRGYGWSSRLVRIGSSTAPFVTVETVQTEQCVIADLALDCKNLGGTSAHGVHFNNPTPADGTREFADQMFTLSNVLIKTPAGWAVKTEPQTRETVLVNVQMRGCGEGGYWNDGTDGSAVACIVSGGRVAGYYDTGSSNRYTGCKVFYTGAESPPSTYDPATAGAGFKLLNSYQTTLTGCEAQDCHVGFVISKSEHFSLTGCHAASNYHVGLDLGGDGDYLHHGIVTGMRVTGNAMRWTAGMRTAGIRVSNAFDGFIQADVDNDPPSAVGTAPCIVETSANLLALRTSGIVTATDSTEQNLLPFGGVLRAGVSSGPSDEWPYVAAHASAHADARIGTKFTFGNDATRWAGVAGVAETVWADRTGLRFFVRNSGNGIQSPVGITSLGYIDLGGMWLRRNGSTFQVSFDNGTTWKTATLT